MSAFCACKRFSASSHTADAGPSITSSVISQPRCAGRQCSTMASAFGPAQQVGVDLVGPERADPVQAVVLLAHRCPGVGDQHIGPVDRGLRVADQLDRAAGLGRPPLGVQQDVAVRVEPSGDEIRTVRPAFAPPSISEWAMLLAPSPR